ncbi:MAG TPA: TMEM175 family protein [Thermoanaerobaculia bacterium]
MARLEYAVSGPPGKPAEEGEKETGRVEAFSDGVFAIAITLLVLDLKIPKGAPGGLVPTLLRQWPTFLAYLTSFATILVMWVNHHKLFTHIRRTTGAFLFLNGILLLFVTVVPFPTALVSEHLLSPDARTAAAIYAATYFAIAIAFNVLWRYASDGMRLIDPRADSEQVHAITRNYRFGPVFYFAAFLLAFVSVPASLGLCMALALFFGVTASIERVAEW